MPGPLAGVRAVACSIAQAGTVPYALMADLGAEVIKIERPKVGDDTRNFAPPYLPDDKGADSSESAYFAGTNRNKRSITLNLSDTEGQAIAKKLVAECDVLAENFKTGTLEKYGLGYEQLHAEFSACLDG